MLDIIKRIHEYSLEDIMSKRFGRYSKTIIQDRALPDVRDGLKPVQRRILYGMYKEKHTYEKPTVKSARSVGDIMGKYHPHGDSSIYDAMVRMSQSWKSNAPLIEMQGNNGSMDGDSAAAMRYTESRLSKISNEFLRDIDKDTVLWTRNYDDSLFEPTVLPVRFPNLLVNGGSGISAGYATNIPPHNLGEILEATIYKIKKPNATLEELMEFVKGPDFPTGAIVEGKQGIIDAFTAGKGKVVIKARASFEKNKGKEQIIITEIPFEVNKQQLVKKINDIRIDKKIDGMIDVRDESDKDGLTIAIDLKKEADPELILNYLYKNTELQVNYNYNMVAIVNRRPMEVGLIDVLDAYISFEKEYIEKRTAFDLDVFKKQLHITEGLVKAISILDEIIALIRASKNKADSIQNLIDKFEFSYEQADAIVTLQLYRLSNTDIIELEEKNKNLRLIIEGLKMILSDPNELKNVMIKELNDVKKEFATKRLSEIKDEITEIKIETSKMIPKDEVVVVVTNEGYIKRASTRSYNESEETLLKENDFVILKSKVFTTDTILLFTDLGNYLYLPVYEIPDLKWKELGKHVSNVIKINPEENIIKAFAVTNFDTNEIITTFTSLGMVKRTPLSEYKVSRYNKPMISMKLKDKDKVVAVTNESYQNTIVITNNGYALLYKTEEIPSSGLRASGVKSISLKNDFVVSAHIFENMNDMITVITKKSTIKRVKLSEFDYLSRARKGILIIRDVKTNPYYILKTFIASNKSYIGIKTKNMIDKFKITDAPISDRYSTGTSISKEDIIDAFNMKELEDFETATPLVLEDIDKKILTIDDFLDNIKIE